MKELVVDKRYVMYKLKKGCLRTIIYSPNDLELYKQAGWSLVEETKKKTNRKDKKEIRDEDTNEQDNIERESNEE